MEILVTGGAGFVGSHCVDTLLSNGYDVVVVDDFSTGDQANLSNAFELSKQFKRKLRVIRGSIGDAAVWEKIPDCDGIWHFAAQSSGTVSLDSPLKDFEMNVSPIKLIVEYIFAKKIKYVTLASAAGALYGKAFSYPTDERALSIPMIPYGATKGFFETYLRALCYSYKLKGNWSNEAQKNNYFTWTSFRIGNVYGSRQKSLGDRGILPRFIDALSKGQSPTIYGQGQKTRDYIYVEDVAAAFLAAQKKMEEVPLDDCFNLGSGVETRDIDIFNLVMKTMHVVASDPQAPENFKSSLKVSEAQFGPTRPGDAERVFLNIEKVKAFLGWKPKMQIHDGIPATVRQYFGHFEPSESED